MVDVAKNAQSLGITLLFVLLWSGTWGIIETSMDYYTVHEKYKFLIYLTFFLVAFVAFLFIDSNSP